MKPTLFQYPYISKEFWITTDASKYTSGAVLSKEYTGRN